MATNETIDVDNLDWALPPEGTVAENGISRGDKRGISGGPAFMIEVGL